MLHLHGEVTFASTNDMCFICPAKCTAYDETCLKMASVELQLDTRLNLNKLYSVVIHAGEETARVGADAD